MWRWMTILFCLVLAQPALAGWDFSRHSIPIGEIISGGPPRDGIPALFDPVFAAAGEAGHMKGDEKVIGVEHNGDARAYPIRILSWHELVNDNVGGEPLLVSW